MIPGLTYIPDYITEEEEENLLKIIDEQEWSSDIKRRTQQYGFKFNYTVRKLDPSMYVGPIPEWLTNYTSRMLKEHIFPSFPAQPSQIIINEYLPGQGISRHTDSPTCFENTIASLSLGSTCSMDLEQYKTGKKGSIMLGRRSLLVFKDEARYDWMHSIAPRLEDKVKDEVFPRGRRVSITFRKAITRGFEMVSKEDMELFKREPAPLKILVPVKIEE